MYTISGMEKLRPQLELAGVMILVVSQAFGIERVEREVRKVTKSSVKNLTIIESVVGEASLLLM